MSNQVHAEQQLYGSGLEWRSVGWTAMLDTRLLVEWLHFCDDWSTALYHQQNVHSESATDVHYSSSSSLLSVSVVAAAAVAE